MPYRQYECLFTTVTVVWYHCMGQPTNIECNTGTIVWGQIRENVLKNEYAKHVGYKQFVVFH